MVYIFWIIFYIVGVISSLIFIRIYNRKFNKRDSLYDDDSLLEVLCMMSWVFLISALLCILLVCFWNILDKITDYIIKNLNL